MKYIPELDSVRGIACLMVMYDHFTSPMFFKWGGQRYFTGGFLGVDLFFILSGYLISSILFSELARTGTISFKKFFFRRALRLFPPIWTVVPLIILPAIYFVQGNAEGIKINYFYLITYTTIFPKFLEVLHRFPNPYWFPHAWSLSIEEIFYIFFPFILTRIKNKKTFASVLFIYFIINALSLPYMLKTFQGGAYHNPFWHFSQIGIGVILGCYFTNYGQVNQKLENIFGSKLYSFVVNNTTGLMTIPLLYILGLFVVVTPGDETPWFFAWGAPLLTCAISFLLIGIISGKYAPGIFKNKLLQKTGKISYGLYLFHIPIYRIITKIAIDHYGFVYEENFMRWFLLDLIMFFTTVVLAVLSWNLIEKRMVLIKNKKFSV